MKVKFLGKNGYDLELRDAMKIFNVGQVLEVESVIVDLNCSRSDVTFKNYKGLYNSVMFCILECNELPNNTLSCYSKCFGDKNLFRVFAKDDISADNIISI